LVTLPKIKIGNVSNGDVMGKSSLSEQVYFATFEKPRYKSEIGKLLYGEQTTYPKLIGKDGAIKKCKDTGMIKKIFVKTPENGSAKPFFFTKRQYYSASPDFLVEKIDNRLKSETGMCLDLKEKETLKYFVGHDSFKSFISTLLFRTDNGEEKIFLRENADFDTVIQTFAFLCCHASVIMKLSEKKINLISLSHFKKRLDCAWSGNARNTTHGKIPFRNVKNIQQKYISRITEKYLDTLFIDQNVDGKTIFKDVKQNSADMFYPCIDYLGNPLLKKLSHISAVEYFIEAMYVEIAAIIVPATFSHFNIKYPDEDERKMNPPLFLAPIKNTLFAFKREIEAITRKQRH
jgi:hypothetical protein